MNHLDGNNRRRVRHASRSGMVLIVVMVAILMLSLAGLSFVTMMATENKAVHVRGNELQLASLVGSGEQLLGAFLDQSPQHRQEAGGSIDNPDLFRGRLVFGNERSARRGRFSVISPRIENDEITGMRFGTTNESARLNLAVLPEWDKQHPGAGRDALMNLPGMTDMIADAILDWIDADDQTRQFGAEADYYAGLEVPYAPRNGVPASLEELLLVRGVTRDLLFGADANFNYQLEPQETNTARSAMGSVRSGARLTWAALLTVYSAERNLNPQGQPRIDLNDKDLEKLYRRLAEVFDPQKARFVILYRQWGLYEEKPGAGSGPTVKTAKAPVAAIGEFKAPKQAKTAKQPTIAGSPESAGQLDFSRPGKFKFSSLLDLIGARLEIPESEGKSSEIVESPLADDPVAMREYLPELFDQASVTAAKVSYGRINVNEAPRAVLAAAPGLDGAMVEQIVATRRSNGRTEDPSRRYATWLLTERVVELPQMKTLMPYLTAGGDVHRAQIVGYFDEPGPAARVELVIDATGKTPRQVYWKDLRLLGRGYSLQSLGAASAESEPR